MVDTIWREARRLLGAELSAKDFEAWVEPLRATGWSDGVLTVEVPSAFFRDWLRRHFLGRLERAVGRACGGQGNVQLHVNRALDVPAPRVRAPRPPVVVLRPRDDSLAPPIRYTFETFVVGTSNQVAFAAARAVVGRPGERFNPLFIYGGCGLGKTHLLSAVANSMQAEGRSGGVAWLSAENFVNEMIVALQADQMSQFRGRFRRIETLVVDDVQFLIGKRRSQEEFFHTFDALHAGSKQIVLASDRPPHEMPGIEATLRSRFASGLLAEVQPPDPQLRRALVDRKASALGLTLAPDLIAYFAERWCANVRILEGALTGLEAFASLTGRPVTLALAEEALAAHGDVTAQRVTIGRIVGEVCRHYRLTRDEIASPRRTARVAVPRQVAMYLCRHHTDAPLGAIGADLGGRDHSTVAHALGAIERRLREDAALREAVAALRARLRA
ncbi:MAG: chromosomal replication initiator protein DnaA [Deltaproteobacteria bacterium]|nr:MAG: chromosomal replication initiator protein DnaA [Deltaproteobacteria bacterium]